MQKSYSSSPERILEIINEIREQSSLPKILQQDSIAQYAKSLSSNKPMKWKDDKSYVSISNMNFTEILDENRSSKLIVTTWMKYANRRAVLFAPGKYGAVVFSENEGHTYVSVVVMSFFH